MPKITDLKARVVLNSRGEKTIECEVYIDKFMGRFSAPSGASIGVFEAPSLPKGGIEGALRIINQEIKQKLVGFEFERQKDIDELIREIDGTENYSRIGGSSAVSISIASAEAAANSLGIPLYKWILSDKRDLVLPIPLGNIVGGGKHTIGKASDIQEFLAFPINAKSLHECVYSLADLHKRVGKELARRDEFFLGGRNDEGAWVSSLPETEILNIMSEAANEIRGETGIRFAFGIDFASSSLWNENTKLYVYERSGKFRTRDEQIEYVLSLIKHFDLKYVEDPLSEHDFQGFVEITRRAPKTLVCGDDLYVTNVSRLMLGTSEGAGNCVVIKPNQVGDLTGAERATEIAKNKGFKVVVSHRSGETPTWHLAHIAVGFASDFIKTGIVGGERVSKLNELMRIEEEVGEDKLMKVKIW